MKFLFDTNIIIHYLRRSPLAVTIEEKWQPLVPSIHTQPFVSVVTLGELESLAIQNSWGERKKADLPLLLEKFMVVDIHVETILQRYAEIDAFSQGKLPGKPLRQSARNMGKNDLWIAASASVLEAKLLTTDADFEHLNGVFLEVERFQM